MYKLNEPIDDYDVIGYDESYRREMVDSIFFLKDILGTMLDGLTDENLKEIGYVVEKFIEDGPPLCSEYLRTPIKLKWIIK